MNILVVHEKNWRAKNVFELQSYAESLSLRGHSVFAIEYDEVWKRNSIWDFGTLSTQKFINVHRSFEDASVTLVRPGFVKVPIVARMTAALTFVAAARALIESERINAILLYSVPTFGLQTIWLGRRYHIPVVFRAIDILPELVPYAALKQPTAFLERQVYSRVDKILALTPRLKRYTIDLGAKEHNIELLLPGVRLDRFHPRRPDPELMARWNIAVDDKVILYMGRTYPFAGLDVMIDDFGQILAEVPDAKLLLVGKGEELENLQRQAKSKAYADRIIFTGFQPFELMPDFINMSKVCIIPFRLCDATYDIIPTKILEYLACGVPTVSTALPGTVEILPGAECGVIYAQDECEVADKVLMLLRNESLRQDLGKKGEVHTRDNFGWDGTIQRLERALANAAL